MRFIIVTGMSGAGKSTALKMLEDAGYFCVDNLPVQLVPKLGELLIVPGTEIGKIALGMDIRSGQGIDDLEQSLNELDKMKIKYEVLFLEASDEVLIKRYKETRRSHPLAGGGRVDEGIRRERGKLAFLKKRADYLVDTSRMLTRELRSELHKIFVENKDYKNIYITVLSFGFKYGLPSDADLVFDVRFLPNPYYVEELRPLSGLDLPVAEFVFGYQQTRTFMEKITDMLDFLLPLYMPLSYSRSLCRLLR